MLVACGSNYDSSSNGLVLVGSQGSAVIQTFSFNLNSGHVASIANPTNDTANKNVPIEWLAVVDGSGSGGAIRLRNLNADMPMLE